MAVMQPQPTNPQPAPKPAAVWYVKVLAFIGTSGVVLAAVTQLPAPWNSVLASVIGGIAAFVKWEGGVDSPQ